MTKWRYREGDDGEDLEKTAKMRSRSRAAKTSREKLEGKFEKKEKDWPKLPGSFAARVVEVHKRFVFVSSEPEIGKINTHDVWLARVARTYLTAYRAERNFVVVGDRVLCVPADERERDSNSDLPQCVIQHLAPRHSSIARKDPLQSGARTHVLASNIDHLLIVASYLSPRVKWGLIDRYLVLAELQDLPSVIVLNKLDLLDEHRQARQDFYDDCTERANYYERMGYPVISICASDKRYSSENVKQIDRLQELLDKKIGLFSGHSGVGKSSLINLFDPEIVQDTGEDSNIFYKGRHTTTFASFIKLNKGGYVIDTPGIRSFVIADYSAFDLSHGFKDIRPFATQCKYNPCSHIEEPDCAVKQAVQDKQIPHWRYQSFVGILLGTTGREGRTRDDDELREFTTDDSEE